MHLPLTVTVTGYEVTLPATYSRVGNQGTLVKKTAEFPLNYFIE
jgi:hypothetical protein